MKKPLLFISIFFAIVVESNTAAAATADAATDVVSDSAAADNFASKLWRSTNQQLSSLKFPFSTDASTGRTQSFYFREGFKYDISTAIVDEEFCDPNSPLSISGYLGVEGSIYDSKDNGKHYFYWMFEKRSTSLLPENSQNTESDEPFPFVLWLNGGPGCSSLFGLLTENGPCLVNPDSHSTTINPYSWTEVAHVLWLDQPANVGYSYGEQNDFNEDMIAEDAYYFLQSFFQSEEGSKYKDSPLYITGESYAGKYIPAIGNRIWEGNHLPSLGNLLHLNLKGLAIGNGLFDSETQDKWYAEMAFNNSHGLKIVDKETYIKMKIAQSNCTNILRKCNRGDKLINDYFCNEADNYCDDQLLGPLQDRDICVYNIKQNSTCENDTVITTYLNLESTKQALHVSPNHSWKACNDDIGDQFAIDREKNSAPQVANLLNNGIPILIYAGDLDFICNYLGVRATVLNLEWDHADEFRSADDRDWNNGAGLVRSSNELTFLQVYDAGHMVPTDQPEHALAMITQFLRGNPF